MDKKETASASPRKRSLRRILGLSLLILSFFVLCIVGFLLFSEAFLIGPSSLILVKKTLKIPTLPAEWSGTKIILMSDFHASKNKNDQELIRRAIELANKQNADLILLLGDFLNGRKESHAMPMKELFPMLKQLKAKYGVYAVLGNHDRWIGTEKITRYLEDNGIPVLENKTVAFENNGRRLHLAGLAERKAQLNLRFVKRLPGEPLIVMAHYPDHYLNIHSETTLIVAGHTHGGQVKLPLLGRPGIPSRNGQRFAYGLIEEKPGKKMFVTSGIGTSMLRVRFDCPPEVVLLTLEK